jgi:hypothetical protein
MPYDPDDPDCVRPHNFEYERAFYFDGETALIIGRYRENPRQSLGMRWMVAEGDLGYPVSHGNPMWMVVPDQLALYILEGIGQNGNAEAVRDRPAFERALDCIRAKLSEP